LATSGRENQENPPSPPKEEGVPSPAGLTLKVGEDTPGKRTLVLPPPPGELGAGVEAEERRAASCHG